jgi:fumarylacetoacetase
VTRFPVDETHDPALTSWVTSANAPGTDFPVQNLPLGVFRRRGTGDRPRIGVAIGDAILDLFHAAQESLVTGADTLREACEAPTLNALMSLPHAHRLQLRHTLSELLRAGSPMAARAGLVPQADAEMLLPASIGDYTDFYASIYHATNVGKMLRPDNPLLPNYKYVPIGYHGRASSIVVSGTDVHRPSGQTRDDAAQPPVFGPTRRLDYELEVGFFVGRSNAQGEPVPIEHAGARLFGLCLLNDWSARDIQAWEYQPLGPFLAKNFSSSISPWVVTMEALAPFHVPAFVRADGDPAPLPYLTDRADQAAGGIDVRLEVLLSSARMRADGHEPMRLSHSTLADLYWTPAQLLAHHTSSGCNLQPGDLLGSGTVSGEAREARGCLLELTWRGADPIPLPSGETRRFLEDGDEVIMRGACEREGFARIGFGECRGVVRG